MLKKYKEVMVIRLTCWVHSIRNSMKRVVIFLSLLFRSHQAYDAVRRRQNTIFVSRFQPYGRITEAYAIRLISREILIMEGKSIINRGFSNNPS